MRRRRAMAEALDSVRAKFRPMDDARDAIGDELARRGVPQDVVRQLLATVPCWTLWAVAKGLLSVPEAAHGGLEALARAEQGSVCRVCSCTDDDCSQCVE